MRAKLHKAEDRGAQELDWLKTRYSFFFSNWYDPDRMGFGALRVLNDDIIAPHSGFPFHSHKDMEIITIVTQGTITHSDNMGNTDISISKGEVQVMSAGTGVTHAEYNNEDEALSLFQIWIEPDTKSVRPRYEQKPIITDTPYTPLVGPMESDFPLHMHQDAYISLLSAQPTTPHTYTLHTKKHGVYLFSIDTTCSLGDHILNPRDALEITETSAFTIHTRTPGFLLILEVPYDSYT